MVVREKLATWTTETEDVGARGCRIVLKRAIAPGALLHLCFEAGAGAEPLAVVAQVAWARKSPPLAAGIAFVSAPPRSRPLDANWIDHLLAAHLRGLAASGVSAGLGAPGSLGGVTLRLGKPPDRQLTAAEVAVLEVAKNAGTLSTIACALDVPTALATLLENETVTVGPATRRSAGVEAVPTGKPHAPPPVARLLSSGAMIVPPALDDRLLEAVATVPP